MKHHPDRFLSLSRGSARTAVIAALAACFASIAWADRPAEIRWSEDAVTVEAPAGTTTVHEVRFTADADIETVRLEAVPALSGLVSIEPATIDAVTAGIEYSVTLSITPGEDAAGRHYGGTVHLREGARTLPATLKLAVDVGEFQGPTETEDERPSPGVLALTDVSETAFNHVADTVRVALSGATFSNDPEDIQLYRGGMPVPDNLVEVTDQQIAINSVLQVGRNDFTLYALDDQGRTLFDTFTLWAGNRTLFGRVVAENGAPLPNVSVRVELGDDKQVGGQTTADANGNFVLTGLPPRTLFLESRTDDQLAGSVAANGADGFVQIVLYGFKPASDIDNNDFSLGIAGWDVGTAPVFLITHEEESAGPAPLGTTANADNRTTRHEALGGYPSGYHTLAATLQNENIDLVLATSGEGPQHISRTFEIEPGTRNVTVRYRFITTEVPGGYFGTEFNDYFNVSIRNQQGGGHVAESQSMNGLGLAAFDASGATAWRERSLAIDTEGDVVQVDMTVANVADGLLNSFLVVDLIKEQTLAITAMTLNDIDNTPLNYLSTDDHPYFGGNTRVHGTVTVEGAEDDSLDALTLEVIQGGGVVATANLASGASSTLLQAFGEDGSVSIDTSRLLFELPAAQAGNVDVSQDGTLTLRARATSANGEEVTEELGSVILLGRYQGANRYSQRDGNRGGDDWAQPSLINIAGQYAGVLWGDFSNMNAGSFVPDHTSHRTGNDVDGWFDGYNARNAATAATIIGHLNAPAGSEVTTVLVTFERSDTNAFWNAIKDVTLDDGRRARDVILPWPGHTGHFHWRNN